MKKKEREIQDRVEIDSIINEAEICRIAFAQNNEPYMVPMFFGYDGEKIYFHTALIGKKVDMLRKNRRVCFEIEGQYKFKDHNTIACKWTAQFESVIGYGIIREINEDDSKIYGLNQIMKKYSKKEWEYSSNMLDQTLILCLEIESMSGKRSV